MERDTNILTSRLTKLKFLNGHNITEAKKNRRKYVKSKLSKTENLENMQYILKHEDIEELQVLIDCVTSLYSEKNKDEAQKVNDEFSIFLKKKMEELGRKVKKTLPTKAIQLLNLKTYFSIYQYSLHQMNSFLETYIDKRVGMVLQLVYNAFNTSFEGVCDILGNFLERKESAQSMLRKQMSEIAKISMSYAELTEMPGLEERLKHDIENGNPIISSPIMKEIREGRVSLSSIDQNYSRTNGSLVMLEKRLLSNPKKMTSVQIHDLISELYETKVKSDIKNLETKMPRRTMEQHCHELFKTKFGLKVSSFGLTIVEYSVRDSLLFHLLLEILLGQ